MNEQYYIIVLNRGYHTYDVFIFDNDTGYYRQVSFMADNTDAASGIGAAFQVLGVSYDYVWVHLED
jgi:hypothetical protein